MYTAWLQLHIVTPIAIIYSHVHHSYVYVPLKSMQVPMYEEVTIKLVERAPAVATHNYSYICTYAS